MLAAGLYVALMSEEEDMAPGSQNGVIVCMKACVLGAIAMVGCKIDVPKAEWSVLEDPSLR